jgi:sarcosine oxidase
VIRLAHFENPAYVPLMQRAYALWRELENLSGSTLLHLTGLLEIGPPAGLLVSGTAAAVRQHGLAHEMLDAAAVMRRFPSYRLPNDFVAVLQPDGGYIEAALAVAGMQRLAAAAGAQIRTGARVVAIEPGASRIRIKTEAGAIEADDVVVAAGPWLGTLLPSLDLPLRVTRQVVGWFAPHDPAQFTAERFPVFILETAHGHHYGFPAHGRMGVKIAKHHHLDECVLPESCARTVTAADEAAIRAPLADCLPDANGRLIAAQTCLYTMTPDNTFILDRVPGMPHLIIASPCCGHGFKFAPVVGEIVADIVTRGATAHDIAAFRLQRFAGTSAI